MTSIKRVAIITAVLVGLTGITAFAGGFCPSHPYASCSFRREVTDTQGRIFTEYYCDCGDTVLVPR